MTRQCSYQVALYTATNHTQHSAPTTCDQTMFLSSCPAHCNQSHTTFSTHDPWPDNVPIKLPCTLQPITDNIQHTRPMTRQCSYQVALHTVTNHTQHSAPRTCDQTMFLSSCPAHCNQSHTHTYRCAY